LSIETRRSLKSLFSEVKFIIDAEQVREVEIEHETKVLLFSIKTENNIKSIMSSKKENEFLDLESFTNDIQGISSKKLNKNKKKKTNRVEVQNEIEDKKSTDVSSIHYYESQSKNEDNQVEDEIAEFIRILHNQSVHKQFTMKISTQVN
jgi:hypothetical protein